MGGGRVQGWVGGVQVGRFEEGEGWRAGGLGHQEAEEGEEGKEEWWGGEGEEGGGEAEGEGEGEGEGEFPNLDASLL